MEQQELRGRVADLSIWACGSEREPRKSLLLLWALGRCAAGQERFASYREVDQAVGPLLEEFGPPRHSHQTEFPFWYLQNDGLWEVRGPGASRIREGKASQPTKDELLRLGAVGGLARDAYGLLRSDPMLLYDLANELVDAHFPESVRCDVLAAVGLDEPEVVHRQRRNAAFRHAVLVAYGYRCAVCDFDAMIGGSTVALDAAHIQWHQAGGPDLVTNGLALCSLHHKLFDRGAFTLSREARVVVSDLLRGGETTQRAVVQYHGQPIHFPPLRRARPAPPFLEWHRAEVFKERRLAG